MKQRPTVSIVMPVLNEQSHIARTLESITRQSAPEIVEILVADGGSTDRTREIAREFSGVTVIENPGRIQAAGLNCAIARAAGDVIVRVDGHCDLAPDYVERCIDALLQSDAVLVGGGMTPKVNGEATATQRAIASAMASRMGAGPARVHVGGPASWVDTVYLGAYRRDDAIAVGGYAEDVGVNEDAEFAIRMGRRGGVWFDPAICSQYTPRGSLSAVAKQFYRYGRSRARTVRRHPSKVRIRQLVAPALVVGLVSPKRRSVAMVYASLIAARAVLDMPKDRKAAPLFAVVAPTMHLSWGVGFLRGLISPPHAATARVDRTQASDGERAALDRQRDAVPPRGTPVPNASGPHGFDQRSTAPGHDVHKGDRPRQVASHQQQTVA